MRATATSEEQAELAAPEARADRPIAAGRAGRARRPRHRLTPPARAGTGPGRPGARRRTDRRDAVDGAPLTKSRSCCRGPRRTRPGRGTSGRRARREANGSSTTIVLLTSRPSVVTASSGNADPIAGSPDGDATTTSRPSSVPGSRAAERRSRSEDPDDREQEEVQEGEEQEPDEPDRRERRVHQSDATASTTSTVSPISIRSPTPSTTSATRTPLTRTPLVESRSVRTSIP